MAAELIVVDVPQLTELVTAGEQGPPGVRGQPFRVDAQGLLADRDNYDGEPDGFTFLATDTTLLYFREGVAHGVWSAGMVFRGPQGDSAYAVAVADGFVGTEAEWLESLEGAAGTNGTDGADGAPGADGADGRSITGASINGSGHLILTYSDSTQADVGLVVGADGLNGSDGIDGEPGADGTDGADGASGADGADGRGIASMAIDGNDHLIITYTDSTTEDAGLIPGAGGAAVWGAIGGTLADQADLVAALAGKVDIEAGKGLSSNDYTTTEQTKLGAIEAGAQVNAAAVSQAEAEAGTGTALRSWTVQRVWQAIAAWWAASAMKTKLDGIATGATANSSDATLLARSNHTGTQAASTISDLTEVTQDMVGAMIVAGTNVSLIYDDVAGTLTISASGGGGGSGIDPESLPAAEALAAGDYVNLYLDAGTVKARKAGGSGKYPAHGFVKAAFSAAATAAVYPLSMTNDALASLAAGTTYFLSTSTAGAVQATAPNSSGVLRQELGVAISATEILHTNSIPVELV